MRLKTVWFHWIDRPFLDYVLTFASAVAMWWAWEMNWQPVHSLSLEIRISVSSNLAVIAAGLLGLGIATISVLFAVPPGPRLAAVLATVGDRLGRLLMATLTGLALAAVGFALTPLFDQSTSPSPYWVVVFGSSILVILRMFRMLWLLTKTVAALSHDAKGGGADAPQSEWVAPQIAESDYEIPKREIR